MDLWGARSTFKDGIREFMVLVDRIIYFLLDFVYQVFFKVANFELFGNSDAIPALFSRIQLLLGLFMVFKLSFSIMNGIINPDAFTDKKAGFGNIVTRTLTMLMILMLVIPISVPNAENSFEKDINNNGILFGILFNLQERIMFGNTIGRIVLGTPVSVDTDIEDTLTDEELQDKQVEDSARELGVSVLKSFIHVNYEDVGDGDPENPENFVCSDDKLIYQRYTQAQEVGDLFNLLHEECDERYAYTYIPFASGLAGLFLVVVIFGFTLDIAVRTVKLTVLRIIAPIPIVSYIDPKSAKDGAFGSWVKVLTSTYLDLFFRLAIIYFGVFLVQLVIDQFSTAAVDVLNDIEISFINIFTFLWILLGIFFFMRMAPKFLRDMFGMKGPGMSNLGLSGIIAGSGSMFASIRAGEVKSLSDLGAALGESSRAAWTGSGMQVQAYNQGKAAPGVGQTFFNAADTTMKNITGNEKMTLGQYGANMRFARRNKLTDGHLDDEKNYMYALDEEYKRAAAMKENANMGRMSSQELAGYSSQLTSLNKDKYGEVDINKYGTFDASGNGTFTDANSKAAYEHEVAKQMESYMLDTETRLNKQKAKVGDIDQERKLRGLDRRFGNNNKYDARRSILYQPDRVDSKGNSDREGFLYAIDKKGNTRTGGQFGKSYSAVSSSNSKGQNTANVGRGAYKLGKNAVDKVKGKFNP